MIRFGIIGGSVADPSRADRLGPPLLGTRGPGRHHSTGAGSDSPGGSPAGASEPSDTTHEPGRLAAWTEFYRRIEGPTEEDPEVFDLLWYQGLTQAEAAAVLGVAERTVNRRWITPRLNLHEALHGQFPGL